MSWQAFLRLLGIASDRRVSAAPDQPTGTRPSVVVGLAAAAAIAGSLVSLAGYEHIKVKEGVRYAAYPDPGTGGAPWTICYGHTKGVTPGMVATAAQCEAWLIEDVKVAEAGVKRLVKVNLSQTEYDAYVSFVFNAGEGNFRTSTMLRLLNADDHRGACQQFPRWIYANKMILNGLKTRRFEEQTMCLTPSRIVYYAP